MTKEFTVNTQAFGAGYTLITLTNPNGTSLSVTDLGARIVSLQTLIAGTKRELVLGFDQAQEYLEKDAYIGATIGRTAGRIQGGQFTINKQAYQVTTDEQNGNNLHGGSPGFESKKWSYEIIELTDALSVTFTYQSPDGEHGFPGNLTTSATYTLTQEDVWIAEITGVSDQDTLFNPTNHVYFNLTGDPSVAIDEHYLFINSQTFASLKPDSIPTGEQIPLTNSAFDFSSEKKLAETFAADDSQKNLVDGIDHPFFLKETGLDHLAASLISPKQDVKIDITTTAPSVVIFTANFGEQTPEMHGKKLAHHGGITFETQVAPGAEQFRQFGSIVLPANEKYTVTTAFQITKFLPH
ncbi:MAG: galactose-1-epimerase [Enterococcus sp.]